MRARRPLLLIAAGSVAATAVGLVFGHGRTVSLAILVALTILALGILL